MRLMTEVLPDETLVLFQVQASGFRQTIQGTVPVDSSAPRYGEEVQQWPPPLSRWNLACIPFGYLLDLPLTSRFHVKLSARFASFCAPSQYCVSVVHRSLE